MNFGPITFSPQSLLPTQWLRGRSWSDFYVFNPALTRYRGELLLVYRVDFGRQASARVACAICRLGDNLQVRAGSIVPLSDTISQGGQNHYDPRFLIYQERLFIHYNNNYNAIPNQIYLVEVDPDTLAAKAPARLLDLAGPRQKIEKNWMFFEHEDKLLAVYAIAPHTILQADLAGAGPVRCHPAFQTDWEVSAYAARWGEPRGGSPPVRVGESYIAIFHSRVQTHRLPSVHTLGHLSWGKRLRRWWREKINPLKIYGGVYGFAARPPFAPTFIGSQPVLRPDNEASQRRPTASHLSPRRVVYPSGLVHLPDGRWLVSYGVHDERCVVRTLIGQDWINGWSEMGFGGPEVGQ